MLNKLFIFITAMSLSLVVNISAEDDHDHGNDIHVQDEAVKTNNEKITSEEDHDDELTVELTTEAVKLGGIEISTTKHERIERTIELPGEVGFNEDRLAHIAPRFAGLALQANYRVGDYVEVGEVVAIIESNESMNSYSITAPISGWVIARHITTGEFVSQENSIYIIADLSTVWVNLAVYPKDANRIKKGQTATLYAVGSKNKTNGLIEYITPIMDSRTRSATARITLPNPDNTWRPGTFVQAAIVTEKGVENLAVEKNAVQYLDEKSVVFVVDAPNRFRPVEVVTGDSDDYHIQILNGLGEGIKYVSQGAFELKARIITSNLDAHAGHGH